MTISMADVIYKARWVDGIRDIGMTSDAAIADALAAAGFGSVSDAKAEALEEAVEAFPLETIVAPDHAVVWLAYRACRMRSPTPTQPVQKQPALADPQELQKAGPSSAMAERGRRGGESSHRVGGHGDGGC